MVQLVQTGPGGTSIPLGKTNSSLSQNGYGRRQNDGCVCVNGFPELDGCFGSIASTSNIDIVNIASIASIDIVTMASIASIDIDDQP